MNEPIAIIGIGCRFPGGVHNPDTFWQLLKHGVDAISDIPASRFDVDSYYDPKPGVVGKIATRQGGFVDHIDEFDAAFFGIPPREANFVDPQQRLLMEVAWEAMEDAGLVPAKWMGSQTGVFVGMWTNDYEDRMYAASNNVNLYITTGGGRYSASGRLSYIFDFHGPSMTVDTACSSSLVTTLLACQSIWNGESEMALAGGTNLILVPQITVGYSKSGMLSPDGRCKFGDASANGYVRSEGVGIVVLKALSRAQADGDPIYALIRGGAVNNDGRSSELLVAPSPITQAAMLREAYHSAGVPPEQVRYVEAHGTGTRVGDPVELTALGEVLGENRPSDRPCIVGSVKTNIGHTEAASGVAGLIKAVLALKNRAIPASLHFNNPSPSIPWDELPFVVPQSLMPWPDDLRPAYAGVNSFGVTGTNAHIVLEAYEPEPLHLPAVERAANKPFLLPLSAQSREALVELARQYQDVVQVAELVDVAYTTALHRTHHSVRLAAVAADDMAMREQLSAFVNGEKRRGLAVSGDASRTARKIAFIFPGQGGQWIGMGRELLENVSAFRSMIEQCETAMHPYVDWSLTEELQSGARFDEIDVVQPLLFAVQISLAAVWRAWGVEPQGVIGHSMGEVAGAYVAGALSLEDAAHIICRRSQLMKRVSGQGAMAVVELTFDEALTAIAGYEDQLGIAVSNGPRSTVISGDPAALETVLEALRSREIFCRPVKVDVAAHSPHMEALRPELVNDLSGLLAQNTNVPLYSTVTGAVQDGAAFDADYWGQNLRQPVLFAGAVQAAIAEGFNTFIEISPHPVLLAAVEQSISLLNAEDTLVLASTRREEAEAAGLLESLGGLYAAGYEVDWGRLYPHGNVLRLPTYPWQRERFWVDESAPSGGLQIGRHTSDHPLLSSYFKSQSGTHYWEFPVDLALMPYLADHQVQGNPLFPAAGYAEMALAAANQAFGAGAHSVEDLKFTEAMFLTSPRVVQVMVASEAAGRATFHCFSRPADDEQAWTLHASGTIRLGETAMQPAFDPPDALRGRLLETITHDQHYAAQRSRRLEYGPAFQGVTHIWKAADESLAELHLPETATTGAYRIHPALLDTCFQTLLTVLPNGNTDTYLPITLDELRLYQQPEPDSITWAYARQLDAHNEDILTGDVLLLSASGQVLLAAEGLRMQRLERGTDVLEDLLYELVWERVSVDDSPSKPAASGNWLILADNGEFGTELTAGLVDWGENCAIVHVGEGYASLGSGHYQVNPNNPDDFRQLLRDLNLDGYAELRGVVHLWSLDAASESVTLDLLHRVETLGSISAMYITQMLSEAGLNPRVWLVTQSGRIEQSPLWGFGAVLANEHPELKPTRVGITRETSPAQLRPAFFDGKLLDVREFEIEQDYLICRQRHFSDLLQGYGAVEQFEVSAVEQPFRAEVAEPGVLDNLQWRTFTPPLPGLGEVLIEVQAVGLNFMNVMSALGIYPGYPKGVGPLGIECSGRIAAVGDGATEWQVGDEVLAMAFDSLGTHVVTDARLVARKPKHLSFEEAATLPIVFLTAYYALNELARLSPNERVLIHAGTGGVGLAAIQLAKLAGAEIYATAGTDEKRAYLRDELGIEHVMDSRSLAFADEIIHLTDGEGVDVILNSLAGEAISRGLSILRPYGRFLEIGKRDIYGNTQLGLLPFQKSLSYFAIDFDHMGRNRPALVGKLLREIVEQVEAGDLYPLPMTVFPAAELVDAFRFMAQAKHVGKIVVAPRQGNAQVVTQQGVVKDDSSYLITGGLGGLGLETARWLANQGARSLVLVGRRGPGENARVSIAELEMQGVRVTTAALDVANPAAVADLVSHIQAELPPLKGVIHAAGVLEDSTIAQMDAARFRTAIQPKMDGAWNLHEATLDVPLDFFVLYSSVAATLGMAGQANYAAGNAFLDGLARYRHGQGLPALSINWGPWSEIGLAAAQSNRGERLAERGLGSITPEEGMAALKGLMHSEMTQATVMRFDATQWVKTYPAQKVLLADLLGEQTTSDEKVETAVSDLRAELQAAEPGRARRALLENHIREQVAQVLGLAANRVDVQKPLRNLGIDSLMTLELRNRLESTLKLSLSATLVFNYPTVAVLATHLGEKLGIPLDAVKSEVPTEELPQENVLDELENLSRDEIAAMLADELDSLDDLLKGN
ncbi:MAG: type I polyketide synthase [Anaerolineae bacterium]|nr:type I polyketide synthase [Anaerolineae bacterium]